jgi:CheY-like chemotaxis protein
VSASPPEPGQVNQPTVRRVVLYVEDNPASLRLMQKIIANWPEMELRGASTAEIGIEMARTDPPALILMDINLPGMNGYEALVQLKTDPITAHIPVMALTANAMNSEQEKALAAGFCAFITKPLNLASLYDTLRHALDVPVV